MSKFQYKYSFLLSSLSIFFALMFMNIPVFADSDVNLNYDSDAVVLMDAQTNEILYEKNSTKQMYPASITKILTAIIAIETVDLQETVKVSEEAIRAIGTRVYLLEDEEITVEQLLYGLMVSSGNDAAIAIAEHIDGSVEEFSERMNRFAKLRVGVQDSSFTNPHGLFEEDHYTTANDMALISSYAMKNETFRDLVSTEYFDWLAEGWETRLYNHHPLLRQNDEVIGIKNGYVSKAGYTLSTAAKNDETELITVTLNASSRYTAQEDTLELLEFGFEHFETQKISLENEEPIVDYVMPNKVPVTTKKDEELSYDIAENGVMTVLGEEDRVVSKIKFDEREKLELPWFRTDIHVDHPLANMNQNDQPWYKWLLVTGFYFFLS
ncbi:D-alanyl-D-alanine carboxypeptidase family protein [Evansella halocellulosilytica]|uniref:D-alanyl-D-alanine carboxypeptidase family protein n=1 Tax=Evansella halocellulosilytica TaxID=2011013 RepID=UPI0015C77475|nr:D-alanyl-D-alanine carboxypeptidase family protein [Evansella halocellulosilytica]